MSTSIGILKVFKKKKLMFKDDEENVGIRCTLQLSSLDRIDAYSASYLNKISIEFGYIERHL